MRRLKLSDKSQTHPGGVGSGDLMSIPTLSMRSKPKISKHLLEVRWKVEVFAVTDLSNAPVAEGVPFHALQLLLSLYS